MQIHRRGMPIFKRVYMRVDVYMSVCIQMGGWMYLVYFVWYLFICLNNVGDGKVYSTVLVKFKYSNNISSTTQLYPSHRCILCRK